MSIQLNISTLEGKTHTFSNIPLTWTILRLKHYIYQNHPFLHRPFPDMDRLETDLSIGGYSLSNDRILGHIHSSPSTLCSIPPITPESVLIFSFRSKSIAIQRKPLSGYDIQRNNKLDENHIIENAKEKKKNTLHDNYMISPCSGPEEVFMDTFEDNLDIPLPISNRRDRDILEDIYDKLNKIEELFRDIHHKMNKIQY